MRFYWLVPEQFLELEYLLGTFQKGFWGPGGFTGSSQSRRMTPARTPPTKKFSALNFFSSTCTAKAAAIAYAGTFKKISHPPAQKEVSEIQTELSKF